MNLQAAGLRDKFDLLTHVAREIQANPAGQNRVFWWNLVELIGLWDYWKIPNFMGVGLLGAELALGVHFGP